jgi:sirohydrochlorin ferrochelatase
MTGFIVFGHGSRVESANQAVREVALRMAEAGSYWAEPAFLELGEPDLAGAVGRLTQRGATEIVVLPYFLTLGTHLLRDLPVLVRQASQEHHDVTISIAPPLDGHPALVQVLLDRAGAALAGVPR